MGLVAESDEGSNQVPVWEYYRSHDHVMLDSHHRRASSSSSIYHILILVVSHTRGLCARPLTPATTTRKISDTIAIRAPRRRFTGRGHQQSMCNGTSQVSSDLLYFQPTFHLAIPSALPTSNQLFHRLYSRRVSPAHCSTGKVQQSQLLSSASKFWPPVLRRYGVHPHHLTGIGLHTRFSST